MPNDTRRWLLAGSSAVAASALAGCATGSSDDSGTDGTAGTRSGTTVATATATDEPTATAEPTTREIVAGAGPLELENVTLTASEPSGYRDIERAPDSEFQQGGVVYIYVEPQSIARRGVSDTDVEYSLTLSAVLYGPDGDELTTHTNDVEGTVDRENDFSEFYAWQAFEIPTEALPGDYTVEFTVTDDLTGARVSQTLEFTIVDPDGTTTTTERDDTHRQSFETAMTADDFNGTLEDLTTDGDGVVHLDVATTAEPYSEDWNYNVGYVAGAFAAIIDEGWQAQRLVTRMASPDAVHRFFVYRDDCVAWANDEISTDEFVSRVMDTIEEV